jgi:hypothetical protein
MVYRISPDVYFSFQCVVVDYILDLTRKAEKVGLVMSRTVLFTISVI